MPEEEMDLLPLANWDHEQSARRTVRQLMGSMQSALRSATRQAVLQNVIPVTGGDTAEGALPPLKLDHFLRMTDETGILKASLLSLPDYQQGYTTADNARALMFSQLLEQSGQGPFIPIELQASRQLAFLLNAFNPKNGHFRGILDYKRNWQDDQGTEDTHGLAIWALGMVLGRSSHFGMLGVARRLFEAALPAAIQCSSLRAWSFSLLGLQEYLHRFPGDRDAGRTARLLLDRLVHQYQENASADWPWLAENLSACSASICQALIAAGHWANDTQAVKAGLSTLEWLTDLQFSKEGIFSPLGDQGLRRKESEAMRFVQRPLEACAMITACQEAYRHTTDARWIAYAQDAFQWFLGRNDLGRPLYDPETGACADGLQPGRSSVNYSSEALLAFLIALLEMRLFDQLSQRRNAPGSQLPLLQIGLLSPTAGQKG